MLQINLKMPEIIREAKILRAKYSVLKKTQQEIWADKLLERELLNEYEIEYKESVNLERLLDQENIQLRNKYNVDDMTLDEVVKRWS